MGKRTSRLTWTPTPLRNGVWENGNLSRSFASAWALGEASDRVRSEEAKRFVEQGFARLHAVPC
jgi:hypothetical protein